MRTILNKSKFIPLFGDWWDSIEPFFDTGGFDPIYALLKKDSLKGGKVCPISNNVFRCFKDTSFKKLKVILVGTCPYTDVYEDRPIADGLLLGCSFNNVLFPPLQKFYDGVEKDVYNLSLEGYKNPNVDFLAIQGVLMYNSALTTLQNTPGAHQIIWEPFATYMFKEVFSLKNVPILLLGNSNKKYKSYINNKNNVFELPHPSNADKSWDTKGIFTEINKLIKKSNKPEIEWLDFVPF